MAHPVTAVQEFFQKSGQTGPEALVYEFSDYCTDTPVPEKRFVCSLKTRRCAQNPPSCTCRAVSMFTSNETHTHALCVAPAGLSPQTMALCAVCWRRMCSKGRAGRRQTPNVMLQQMHSPSCSSSRCGRRSTGCHPFRTSWLPASPTRSAVCTHPCNLSYHSSVCSMAVSEDVIA